MKNVILFLFLLVTLKTAAQKGDTLFNDSKCPAEVQYHGVKFNSPVFDGYPLPLGPPVYPPPVAFGPTGQEKRIIHWVHGLAGNVDSWATAGSATEIGADIFTNADIEVTTPSGQTFNYPARKVQSELHTYNETNINAGITSLRTTINGVSVDAGHTYDRDFIIAHSQGGIVSRGLDAYLSNDPLAGPRRFYGIATFSTPHGGARILNSRNEGLINDMIGDLCTSVLTTKLAEVLEERGMLNLFIDQASSNDSIQKFCNSGGTSLAGIFLSSLSDPKTLSASYLEGAEFVKNLNEVGNPDVYKAAFASIEYADSDGNSAHPKQLLWRMLSSFDTASGADPFSADPDDSRVETMNEIMADWQAQYNFYDGMTSGLFNNHCEAYDFIFNPIGCIAINIEYNNLIDQRDTYREALEWINGVDDQWATIIGARTTVMLPVSQSNECQCNQWTTGGQLLNTVSYFLDNPEDCSSYDSGAYNESAPFYTSCAIVPTLQVNWHESDGAVLLESQKAFPGVLETMRLEKMNHFQVRNSSETARGLNALFNGTIEEDIFTQNFFKTDKKN